MRRMMPPEHAAPASTGRRLIAETAQGMVLFGREIDRHEWYYKCTTFPPSCKRVSGQIRKKHEKFFSARKNREKDRPKQCFPLDEQPPRM